MKEHVQILGMTSDHHHQDQLPQKSSKMVVKKNEQKVNKIIDFLKKIKSKKKYNKLWKTNKEQRWNSKKKKKTTKWNDKIQSKLYETIFNKLKLQKSKIGLATQWFRQINVVWDSMRFYFDSVQNTCPHIFQTKNKRLYLVHRISQLKSPPF